MGELVHKTTTMNFHQIYRQHMDPHLVILCSLVMNVTSTSPLLKFCGPQNLDVIDQCIIYQR